MARRLSAARRLASSWLALCDKIRAGDWWHYKLAPAAAVVYATALAFDVPLQTFFNTSLVDYGDMSTGFAKCIAYGAAIPIVSGYCGLSTFGGSEGVGWATTRAVVNSSLAIIILNFFISGTALLIFPVK